MITWRRITSHSIGVGLAGSLKPAFGQDSGLTKGDVAILRVLAAAELIEADLWTQYAEPGGIGDNPPIEVAPNQQLNSYQADLSVSTAREKLKLSILTSTLAAAAGAADTPDGTG
jgi:hypothetical protein